MARPSRYSREVQERAVRMVREHGPEHPSQWASMRLVAENLGCTVEALRRWVRRAEQDAGKRPGLSTGERQRLTQLEREDFELKRANEILRKASALFAQALSAEQSNGHLHRSAPGQRRESSRSVSCLLKHQLDDSRSSDFCRPAKVRQFVPCLGHLCVL